MSLRSILFSTSFMLLAIRLAGAGAGFLGQLLLARLLAPDALGIFFAATSLAAVLGLVASLGYPDIVPRFVSRYRQRERPVWAGAFMHRAFVDSLIVALATGAAIVIGAAVWPDASASTRITYILAGTMVPLLALFGINYAVAIARRAFAVAYGPESLLRPFLFLAILATLYIADAQASLVSVTAAYFGVTTLMGGLQFVLIRSRIPDRIAAAPARLVSRWRGEGIPLIAVALYTNLFADLAIILASPLLPSAELAAFGVALKLALLVGFCVQVAHQVILPDLADAHARRALSGARDTLRTASILPIVFTLVAVLASAIGGEYALALFHPDFATAKWALTILIACQLLRALAGPSALLLTTIGAQGLNAAVCLASTVVLGVGNLALIPTFGLNGAAVAVLLAWSFWLVASAIVSQRMPDRRSRAMALVRRAVVKQAAASTR